MNEYNTTTDQSRLTQLLYAILIFGVAFPVGVLGVLYGVAHFIQIEFGTVIFWFTGFAVLAGLLLAGWGRRMDAARPSGELFRNSATDYGKEVSQGRYMQIPLPARLIFILTGTVLLGWVVVIATI